MNFMHVRFNKIWRDKFNYWGMGLMVYLERIDY